jgi:hypothetical protein
MPRAKDKVKIECYCGSIITKYCLSAHRRTIKHRNCSFLPQIKEGKIGWRIVTTP